MKEPLPLHKILKMQKRHHRVYGLAAVYLNEAADVRFCALLSERAALSQPFPASAIDAKRHLEKLNEPLNAAVACLTDENARRQCIPPWHRRLFKKWQRELAATGFVPTNS